MLVICEDRGKLRNTMKILNIHGYKGDSENSACRALRELGLDVISPQIDYDADSPENILETLKAVLIEKKPDMLVGTSLGGFFALALAVETGLPARMVNPCLMPFITLPELGYSGDICRYIGIFGSFAKLEQDNICAIIGGQDEVISYYDFTEKIIKDHVVYPEGKHSGATLPLKDFFGESIK